METADLDRQLDTHIENQEWDAATDILRVYRTSSYGWTKLHCLCSEGGTTVDQIALIASLYPDAISIPDTYLGDTCLHIICRNSQLSSSKLQCLLKYCDPEALLMRNVMGGTALHSAANHNAVLSALQLLIETNPLIVKATTREGQSAVSALWLAYVQTIPGQMMVGEILNHRHLRNESFDRFWAKVEYLVAKYFCTLPSCPETIQDVEQVRNGGYVLHGLIRWSAPINLVKVCLYYRPETANVVDSEENVPLHILLENRPYRLKEREIIETFLMFTCSEYVGHANHVGDIPLHIAIRNKIPIPKGTDLLLQAAPCTVRHRDVIHGLYPFQFAAMQGSSAAIVDTVYTLLIHQPDLVHRMVH